MPPEREAERKRVAREVARAEREALVLRQAKRYADIKQKIVVVHWTGNNHLRWTFLHDINREGILERALYFVYPDKKVAGSGWGKPGARARWERDNTPVAERTGSGTSNPANGGSNPSGGTEKGG